MISFFAMDLSNLFISSLHFLVVEGFNEMFVQQFLSTIKPLFIVLLGLSALKTLSSQWALKKPLFIL